MIGLEPSRGLAALARALRAGEIALVEYLEGVEARFQEREAQILAFLPEPERFARLRGEAARLLAQYPEPVARPPLFGVLVGVKDIFRVDGFPTRAGSRLPPEVFTGPEASCVTALRRAGALILGKTVSTEFAYFAPGPTRNPHALERTPGGSSSGSAAAVAAGLCPLALGSQTIGSTIRPAAFCGIAGFKPTYDRIARDGMIPLAPSLDHVGLLAPDVAGLALAASVLCTDWGLEPARGTQGRRGQRGPRSAPAQRPLPASQSEGSAPADRRLPVLGVPEGPYLQRADQEGLEAFREACTRLADAGYLVRSVRALSDFAEIERRHRLILAAEAARVHGAWYEEYRELYDERTAELLEGGRVVSDAELADALRRREGLRQALTALMDEHGLDLWIAPAAPGAAPLGLESTGDPVMNVPWTQAGLPVLGVPCGRSADGLPLGLQVVARWNADEALLAWGEGLEAVLRA